MAALIILLIILAFLLAFPFFSKKTTVPPVITGVVTAFSVIVCKQWKWIQPDYSIKSLLLGASVIAIVNLLYTLYYRFVKKTIDL